MLSEMENYRQRIDDLRGQVRDLIASLPVVALNWRPLAGGDTEVTNSLAVLASHVAGAEHFWIGEVVGGRPATRDRDAEFAVQATGAGELVAALDRTAAETEEILTSLPAAELDNVRDVRDRTVPVRWCLLHVVDHTALHLGHMQLTYQLWEGGQGKPSPLWYDRLRSEG